MDPTACMPQALTPHGLDDIVALDAQIEEIINKDDSRVILLYWCTVVGYCLCLMGWRFVFWVAVAVVVAVVAVELVLVASS